MLRMADNLTTILVPLSRNLGTLTSWNPLDHPRLVTGLLYLALPRTFTRNLKFTRNRSSLSSASDAMYRAYSYCARICTARILLTPNNTNKTEQIIHAQNTTVTSILSTPTWVRSWSFLYPLWPETSRIANVRCVTFKKTNDFRQ
jgi:hypothetical protein